MDKYVKVKSIGEGSFGKAVLVKNKEDGLQYVVKEISISKMSPKERNEARKEVKVLSKMQHPNIVRYEESFEEKGCLYIVMEYCEGGDLYAKINAQRGMAFSEVKVIDWFIQICLALKHVHDRKILHRDIKTSNIFLTKNGTIKLGDFGIARVLNNTMELARTCIGTPYYLSPEICENKPYNNKSDVWAVGCVLYEVLTLKHAFEAGNMKNLVLKIIRGSYPPVSSRYSHDLRHLLSLLFRRNPRDRPSINSILRMPFISKQTQKYLSPEQHEEEFSHTVLHREQPLAGRGAVPRKAVVRPASANARNRQIAGIYGKSVAASRQARPVSAASRYNRKVDINKNLQADVERRRQKFIQDEQKRRQLRDKERRKLLEEAKKKQEDEMRKRQMERDNKIKINQINKARDEARRLNLKRSADMLEDHKNDKFNEVKPVPSVKPVSKRPVSARERGQYEKYHDYLDKIREGNRQGAANVVAPKLDQVKMAWENRVNAQNAVFDAMKNKENAVEAAKKARVVNDFWQRKQEAEQNRQRGKIAMHGEKYKDYFEDLQPAKKDINENVAAGRNREEDAYLARLRQIRIQNFNERRLLKEKMQNNNIVGVQGKQKQEWLQKQAGDNANFAQVAKPMVVRPAASPNDILDQKAMFEEKARNRGVLPPDDRVVKYNPAPIGITQALKAVGHVPDSAGESEPSKKENAKPEENLRKNILKRVNQKFVSEEEKQLPDNPTPAFLKNKDKLNAEQIKKILNVESNVEAKHPAKHWEAGSIRNKLEALPLQETASQMEETIQDDVVMNQAKNIVAAKKWSAPSDTVVNHLNNMEVRDPTLTLPPDRDQKSKDENETINNPVLKPSLAANFNNNNLAVNSPLKFSINIKPAISEKPPNLSNRASQQHTEDNMSKSGGKSDEKSPIYQKTVILGDKSAASSENTPVIKNVLISQKSPNEIKNGTFIIKPASSAEDKSGSTKSTNGAKITDSVTATVESISDKVSEIRLSKSTEKLRNSNLGVLKDAWVEEKDKVKPEVDSVENTAANVKIELETRSESKPSSPSSPDKNISTDNLPLFAKNTPVGAKTAISLKPSASVSTPQNLSKTLFTTAKDQINFKLTLGHFDSPNPKMLRTCSLPDLTKVTEEEEEDNELNNSQSSFNSLDVRSSMNDTNFDDVTRSINVDGGAASNEHEDDDESVLRANLQSLLLNDSDNGSDDDDNDLDYIPEDPASSSSSSFEDMPLDDPKSDDDDWGSDDCDEDDDNQSQGSGCSVGSLQSVFSRLEASRARLEKELGLKEFLKAYRYIQAIHEDEEENIKDGEMKIREILGDKHDKFYPRILQLVMADGAYCEGNA